MPERGWWHLITLVFGLVVLESFERMVVLAWQDGAPAWVEWLLSPCQDPLTQDAAWGPCLGVMVGGINLSWSLNTLQVELPP